MPARPRQYSPISVGVVAATSARSFSGHELLETETAAQREQQTFDPTLCAPHAIVDVAKAHPAIGIRESELTTSSIVPERGIRQQRMGAASVQHEPRGEADIRRRGSGPAVYFGPDAQGVLDAPGIE